MVEFSLYGYGWLYNLDAFSSHTIFYRYLVTRNKLIQFHRFTKTFLEPLAPYRPDCKTDSSVPPWAIAVAVIVPIGLLCGLGLAYSYYKKFTQQNSSNEGEEYIADQTD